MSKQHSPGPWLRRIDDNGIVSVVDLYGETICVMNGNNNDGSNGKLISAAPEMYAELARLVESFGFEGDHPACLVLSKAR